MMIVDLVIGVIAGVTSSHVSSTSEPSSHDSTSFCDSLCTINLRTELLAEQSYCDLLPFDQYADRKSYESCVVGRLIAFNLECVSLCTTNTMLPSYYDWGCDGTHKVLVCQNGYSSMVQQLLFAIADKRKEEPDNMVEDFRGGRGAHINSDKQESADEKFADCNATCNKVREELLTRARLDCELAIDNSSANLTNACVEGTVRAFDQTCPLICSKAENSFSSNKGCSGVRVKYWCKKGFELILPTLESYFNVNTTVFTRGTRKHRVSLVHDNTSVPKNQGYQEYMFSEGTMDEETMFSKIQGWGSESWTNSYEPVETKYSKFWGWVSGSRNDKPVPVNDSSDKPVTTYYSLAFGKIHDFHPVLYSFLKGIGNGYFADTAMYFYIWMIRQPEPSVNSRYWDPGTSILIFCLLIFCVWIKNFKSRGEPPLPARESSVENVFNINFQSPFMPTHHNQLQSTQQYNAQLQQSQQYHPQLHQKLLSQNLSIPSPSMPYSHTPPYCNNIQPRNLHAGQFSTPPRSEHRLVVNAHTGLLDLLD